MFSLLLKGGHPKVKLLWTAGGATLSPLQSSETEEIGDDGQRELKSVCALERSTRASGRGGERGNARPTSNGTSAEPVPARALSCLILMFPFQKPKRLSRTRTPKG